MKRNQTGGISASPANGSWNIYKTVLEYDGLVDDAYALEIETEGNWSQPMIVSLDTLSSVIPMEAATLLVAMIQSTPEPETVLYGDDIDVPKVYGWSLEFSVVNANPLPTAIGGKRLAVLTAEENNHWKQSFAFHVEDGKTDDEASTITWLEMQDLFPRLKSFDGCKP